VTEKPSFSWHIARHSDLPPITKVTQHCDGFRAQVLLASGLLKCAQPPPYSRCPPDLCSIDARARTSPTLQEQLLDFTIAERIAQVPSERLHDKHGLVVPTLEVALKTRLEVSGHGGQDYGRPPVPEASCRPYGQSRVNASGLPQALLNLLLETECLT
jgi:hypothetical protein